MVGPAFTRKRPSSRPRALSPPKQIQTGHCTPYSPKQLRHRCGFPAGVVSGLSTSAHSGPFNRHLTTTGRSVGKNTPKKSVRLPSKGWAHRCAKKTQKRRLTSPRLDLGTLCVLDTCDNQLHHEALLLCGSQHLALFKIDQSLGNRPSQQRYSSKPKF
jgi:hypothetical protein